MLDLAFEQIKDLLSHWGRVPSWLRKPISFGHQIFTLRRTLGMTQTQLAKFLKMDQAVVVRLEKEEVDPQISTLQKFAAALNCELLVRMVPKEDLEKFLRTKAKEKAKRIIQLSVASADLEEQKPSSKAIQSEINRMAEGLLKNKRSKLWD